MFGSILPISLQQIEYEKNYVVHSNELAKSYTMKPMTIYIDKYLGGDIVKLVVFPLLAYRACSSMFGSILQISLQQIEYEKKPRSAFK